MLDPENNGTVSPESLWRMTGGSQIGNYMKSVDSQSHQNGRPNLKISDTSVTKNDMGSVKCSFRRACAVEWFGQISRLGSSVASIWYMATDFGRRFVTWAHYTTWAQSRDFRGRKFTTYSHPPPPTGGWVWVGAVEKGFFWGGWVWVGVLRKGGGVYIPCIIAVCTYLLKNMTFTHHWSLNHHTCSSRHYETMIHEIWHPYDPKNIFELFGQHVLTNCWPWLPLIL